MQNLAQLENARRDLQRYQALFKQDSIAKQQVDTQAALVRQYEGTVKSDQANRPAGAAPGRPRQPGVQLRHQRAGRDYPDPADFRGVHVARDPVARSARRNRGRQDADGRCL
ncbi:hypothetical protein G6F31_020230 [Rhizopus arrhizus]|nr:hypothetical protein G6F31_020230 [Rhizopus arrhizus]